MLSQEPLSVRPVTASTPLRQLRSSIEETADKGQDLYPESQPVRTHWPHDQAPTQAFACHPWSTRPQLVIVHPLHRIWGTGSDESFKLHCLSDLHIYEIWAFSAAWYEISYCWPLPIRNWSVQLPVQNTVFTNRNKFYILLSSPPP